MRKHLLLLTFFVLLLSSTISAEAVKLSLFGEYKYLRYPMDLGWNNNFGYGFSGELSYKNNIKTEFGFSFASFEPNDTPRKSIFWIQPFGAIGYNFVISDKFSITSFGGFTINTLYFHDEGDLSLKHNQEGNSTDETEMGFFCSMNAIFRPVENYSIFISPAYHKMLADPAQTLFNFKLGISRDVQWQWLDY